MSSSIFKVLHLTDSHLFSDQDQALMNVKTQHTFQAVIKHVQLSDIVPDLIVVTGDISQDYTQASYQYCRQKLAMIDAPFLWVPGNHDMLENMRRLTPEANSFWPAQCYSMGNWQIILLNTQVPGEIYGELDATQLDFLQHEIACKPDAYFLIGLHHYPGNIGSQWLDKYNLRNSPTLWSTLSTIAHRATIICGHVHQVYEQVIHGHCIFSTPSTCFQFKNDCDQFTLDDAQPGYRWLYLGPDGELETQVVRLQNYPISVNMSATGY